MRATCLEHEFVALIPDDLSEATLYISMPYATAAHLCLCGCGERVVTPLSPTDWRLVFDGESVSLEPSIGNWNFKCQSHYCVRRSRVVWGGRWSQARIAAGRVHDWRAKQQYFGDVSSGPDEVAPNRAAEAGPRPGWVRRWFARRRS